MSRLVVFVLIVTFSLVCLHAAYAQQPGSLREPVVIKVIRLNYADAQQLASILAPLLSKDGRMVAYSPTNSLIIRDRASLVKRLVEIIKGDASTR